MKRMRKSINLRSERTSEIAEDDLFPLVSSFSRENGWVNFCLPACVPETRSWPSCFWVGDTARRDEGMGISKDRMGWKCKMGSKQSRVHSWAFCPSHGCSLGEWRLHSLAGTGASDWGRYGAPQTLFPQSHWLWCVRRRIFLGFFVLALTFTWNWLIWSPDVEARLRSSPHRKGCGLDLARLADETGVYDIRMPQEIFRVSFWLVWITDKALGLI